MPRKTRPAKRRIERHDIRACVVTFLETGELAACEREAPWVCVTLANAHAYAARAAWLEGNETAAIEALRRCVASDNLFV